MQVSINVWAVLLAAVSSMVIGAIYYHKAMFGGQWMKLAKVDDKQFRKAMPRVMPLLFISAFVTAYVMAYVMFLYHNFFVTSSWLMSGLVTSLILWFGFSATTLVVHNSLDQRSSRLTYISLGNRLLSLLAMGLILGWLHP